jgi:NTP pyrophosphatase (non-canonical NTP hydrolase)
MGIDTAYEKMARTVLEYTRSKQQKEEISELVMNLEMVCIQACKELETELNQIKKQTHES